MLIYEQEEDIDCPCMCGNTVKINKRGDNYELLMRKVTSNEIVLTSITLTELNLEQLIKNLTELQFCINKNKEANK